MHIHNDFYSETWILSLQNLEKLQDLGHCRYDDHWIHAVEESEDSYHIDLLEINDFSYGPNGNHMYLSMPTKSDVFGLTDGMTGMVHLLKPRTCTGFGLRKKHVPQDLGSPQPGQKIRLFSGGIGSLIIGVDIEGIQCFYKTKADCKREAKQYAEEREATNKNNFENNKASLDADYESLPQVFKGRIDKFRNNNPDFRWEYEAYEMFCCTQAVIIADSLKTVEAIDAWRELSCDEMKEQVTGFDDGHSGNTMGCAVSLAKWYLTKPEAVRQLHGAMAPLVGSTEYGCVPSKINTFGLGSGKKLHLTIH